jgi:amidase
MRPLCEPLAYGPTRNPWNTEHSTGGSSGGSAAAVAAGVVPVAHANDVGGSIRIPASMCGLVGLKPSRGRSTLAPDFYDAMGGLAEELVVARSVRDVATVLDLVTGPAPGDWAPTWPAPASFAAAAREHPGRLRVGFAPDPTGVAVDPAVAAVVEAVAARIEELGHTVERSHPAALDEDLGPFLLPHYACGTSWIVDHHWPRVTGRGPIPEDLIEPGTAMLAEIGRSFTGGALLGARELAQAWNRRLLAWFDTHDVLVLPVLPVLPPRLGAFDASHDGTLIALAAPFNLSGQPAMSLPLGEHDGLPVGVQLVAGHGREALLLQLATQIEAAWPWAGRRPPVSATP